MTCVNVAVMGNQCFVFEYETEITLYDLDIISSHKKVELRDATRKIKTKKMDKGEK